MGEPIQITQGEAEKLNMLLDIINPGRVAQESSEESTGPNCHSEATPHPGQADSPAMASAWLDIKQTAKYIHVSRSKVYELIRESKIPAVRVGHKYVIKKEQLDELVEAGMLA